MAADESGEVVGATPGLGNFDVGAFQCVAAALVLKSELLADAGKAGMSHSALSRAGRRMGILSEPLPGRRGPVVWSLPDVDPVPPGRAVANEQASA